MLFKDDTFLFRYVIVRSTHLLVGLLDRKVQDHFPVVAADDAIGSVNGFHLLHPSDRNEKSGVASSRDRFPECDSV